MIKALWFMIKVAAVVGLALWVVEQPGEVEVEWLDYTLRIQMGLFLLGLLGLILVSIFLYNVIKTFVGLPKSYGRYREVRRFEKGYKALELGLTAVAAGDGKVANYQAHRAEKMMPQEAGLPLLLKAQAARMQGREEDAQKAFVALLEHKDAAFLGARGLLQAALDAEDYERARGLAHKALAIHPKQPWLLKIVYDMEIRLKRWADAEKILHRAVKAGAIERAQADSDRVAMLHAQGDELLQQDKRAEAEKMIAAAHRINAQFVPSVVALARMHHENGQRRKAVKLVEKAWKHEPHPDLAKAWDGLISKDRGKKPLGRVQWFERLLKLNPASAVAQMEAGRIAMEEGLWGEAREYLRKAEEIEPRAGLYHLWAALEDKAGGSEAAVQKWLDKAADAPLSKAWVCAKSGRMFDEWQPIARPYGGFNTIAWAVPHAPELYDVMDKPSVADGVIEAPKKTG